MPRRKVIHVDPFGKRIVYYEGNEFGFKCSGCGKEHDQAHKYQELCIFCKHRRMLGRL